MAFEQASRCTERIEDGLLVRIGRRVRRTRERQSLTRKTLSELSGVSQRFLAHLENGTANISIVKLKAIADALDIPIVSLFAPEAADGDAALARGGETGRNVTLPRGEVQIHPAAVATLYRRAPTEVRHQVMNLLVRSISP